MTMTPIATMTTIGAVPSCVYILCSLVANAGMAITGFGSALLFILVYTLCEMCGLLTAAACTPAEICSMKYAVFFQALSLLGSTPYLVYKATRSSRRRTTRGITEEEEEEDKNAGVITQKLLSTLLPATLVATPCGQWFQEKVPSSWIRILLGIVITTMMGYKIVKAWRKERNTTKVVLPQQQQQQQQQDSCSTTPPQEQMPLLPQTTRTSRGGNTSHGYTASTTSTEQPWQDEQQQQQQQQFFASKATLWVWGTGIGVCSGFLGGLIGMRGPPVMLFFLHFPCFSKTTIRSVGAVLLLCNMLLRLLYYSVSDVLFYSHTTTTKEDNGNDDDDDAVVQYPWFLRSASSSAWWLYGGVIVAGIIGVPIGDTIHQYIDQQKFQFLLGLLLTVSGIVNIVKGLSEVMTLS